MLHIDLWEKIIKKNHIVARSSINIKRFVCKREYIRRVSNMIAIPRWRGQRNVDWPVSTEGAYQVRVDVAKSCSKWRSISLWNLLGLFADVLTQQPRVIYSVFTSLRSRSRAFTHAKHAKLRISNYGALNIGVNTKLDSQTTHRRRIDSRIVSKVFGG